MKLYWSEDVLHIEPETQREGQALIDLTVMSNIRLVDPITHEDRSVVGGMLESGIFQGVPAGFRHSLQEHECEKALAAGPDATSHDCQSVGS